MHFSKAVYICYIPHHGTTKLQGCFTTEFKLFHLLDIKQYQQQLKAMFNVCCWHNFGLMHYVVPVLKADAFLFTFLNLVKL